MPSDIRSFFGGKGGQVSSQEQVAKNKNPQAEKTRAKGRAKRKVLSDSDDEVQGQTRAKKTTPRRQIKRDSPVGELTTTSDYFATSGKSKPSRSTPIRSKTHSTKDVPQSLPEPSIPKGTPTTKHSPLSKSPKAGRTSSRRKKKPNYAASLDSEDEDEDFIPKTLKNDQASDDDIFEAEYRSSRNGAKDEYISEEGEDEEIVMPPRRRAKSSNESVVKKDKPLDDSDLEIEDASKPVSSPKISRGRKRKSEELDDEDDDNADATPKKKANSIKSKSRAKESTAKKARKADVEDSTAERAQVQDIFDSIPTIQPPTPPARDESKKFDFRAAAQRSQAPPAINSKEHPVGAENCLAGLTFVFTGLLDGLDRTQGTELIKRHGGKVTTGPSSKTSFVVLGNDAGPKKLETIAKFKLKVINEEGLFELIRRLPANGGDGKAAEKFEADKKKEEKRIEEFAAEIEKHERQAAKEAGATKKALNAGKSIKPVDSSSQKNTHSVDSRLWTVKYAPTATSMICGNKTQVDKLQAWLRAWPSNARTKFKKAGKDGHGVFRAVMIHGPPGIGKTTAAHLAAKLEGYDIVESNASDTRSKKLVEVGLKGVLDTTSLLGYFAGDGKRVEVDKKKLVLIMDEVDGMSAGDRGGVGALAAVCKKTSIPMILICNERRIPKMKPFDHVTYDLPFRRPTVDQIRSRIMTICFREGLKIPSNVVNALIEGTRADIRQVINMLSTAKLDQDVMDYDQSKKMSKSWEKHVILKPWDIVGKIIGGGMFAPSSTSSLNDKIELYFNDHEFSSLMLQENYLGSNPILANNVTGKEKVLKLLELTDKAAESISDGDLVDRMIHGSQQQWSLMPTHAVFSFVRPASFISGSQVGGQTRFTSWLGNNSKQGKLMRFIKDIQAHMRLRASGDRHEIRQQYLPVLWYRLIKDLETRGKDGVEDVIELMDSYFLTKDDWDAILELGLGPMTMESVKLDTQTKASFTRIYNQQSHPLPFMKADSVIAPKKSSRERPDLEEAIDESDDGEDLTLDADANENDDEDEVLDLKKDKYVKAPKKKAAPKKSNTKKAAQKGKGKGKVKEEVHEEIDDESESGSESEEDVKPRKRKGAASKGKSKK